MKTKHQTYISEYKRIHDDIDSTLAVLTSDDVIKRDIINYIKGDNNIEGLLTNKTDIVQGIYETIKAQAEDYDVTKMQLYIERYAK